MQELNFQDTIPFLFNRFSNRFKSIFDKNLQSLNLHGGQIFILLELWQEDGLSQVQLAGNLQLSPPTVHKMIHSLVGRGFVECRLCTADNRLKRVFLTEKGQSIRSEVADVWVKFEEQMLCPFSETEKLIFRQLLQNLNHTAFGGSSAEKI